jgi:hypothetical protein
MKTMMVTIYFVSNYRCGASNPPQAIAGVKKVLTEYYQGQFDTCTRADTCAVMQTDVDRQDACDCANSL